MRSETRFLNARQAMALEKIIDIQKVGCFERLHVPGSVRFSKVTLIFGENGWGKSTIADILRSLTTDNPRILSGRETLASAGEQKVILLVDGKQAKFESECWQGVCPKVAVYDQIFVNENVFSGDTVSHDHLKRQYGLVVGEKGVRLTREIIALDSEVSNVNATVKRTGQALQRAMTTLGLKLTVDQFCALEQSQDIDALIAAKVQEVARVSRVDEINRAALPEPIALPREPEQFRDTLTATIEGVAQDAYQRLRDHIDLHYIKEGVEAALSHEAWLEAGLAFSPDDPCPYCGQELRDRSLIDAFASFFSERYKELAGKVRQHRATLQRHVTGEYAAAVQQTVKRFDALAGTWKTLADVALPVLTPLGDHLAALQDAARELDGLFAAKQADLVTPLSGEAIAPALTRWETALKTIQQVNGEIATYRLGLETVRKEQESADLKTLQSQLATLRGRKRRFEADIGADISEREQAQARKRAIEKEKGEKRTALTAHTKTVTEGLGTTINAYLDRLGAGFRIDYQQPNYRGNEPAAAYNILINNVPVPPRASNDDVAKHTFKNTLSAGDKSVLALAIFLATLRTRVDLSEMIVVLDDPFTSMDEFRRSFTVNEINKLVPHSAQVIVLSHEKNFLRLIWDTVEKRLITSLSIQTGAPGLASLCPFDLERATRPRNVTERMEVQDFYELGNGEPGHIRSLLRKVLESSYRQGDPEIFAPDELLDGIIRKIDQAPADYQYKAALEELQEINRYTRNFHHAPVEGSVTEDTSVEELKTYCRRVLALTRGSA